MSTDGGSHEKRTITGPSGRRVPARRNRDPCDSGARTRDLKSTKGHHETDTAEITEVAVVRLPRVRNRCRHLVVLPEMHERPGERGGVYEMHRLCD